MRKIVENCGRLWTYLPELPTIFRNLSAISPRFLLQSPWQSHICLVREHTTEHTPKQEGLFFFGVCATQVFKLEAALVSALQDQSRAEKEFSPAMLPCLPAVCRPPAPQSTSVLPVRGGFTSNQGGPGETRKFFLFLRTPALWDKGMPKGRWATRANAGPP